jgi:NADH dehydrogenase
MTKKVVIVGGGYAGVFAARRLGRRRDVRVVLVEPREHQHSLPLLPDLIGRNLPPDRLRYPLAKAAQRWGFEHIRDEVESLDAARMAVVGRHAEYSADAILLACGCGTVTCPFTADDRLHTVSDVESAAALRRAFVEGPRRNWVVAGGGYTGVETATHLWRCAQREGLDRKLFVVERGDALCGNMGAPFAEYIERNVMWLGIEVMRKTRVVGIRDGDVLLEGDRRVTDAGLVWTVGTEGRRFARELDMPQTPSGRLSVNPFLQLERLDTVFAAGDAAAFPGVDGRPLRQSVQAAVMQGVHAADNIVRKLESRPMVPYKHRDPGYVVPMAHGRGCGIVLGLSVYGRLPLLLHAVMSVYRSFGANRGPALLWQLLRKG